MAWRAIDNIGEFGVVRDQVDRRLPDNALSDAKNFRFIDGYAERVGGESAVFDAPSVTPYFIAPFVTPTNRFWCHAGLAAVYVDNGTTRTDITGSAPTGGIDDRWNAASFSGNLVMCNGTNVPQYWNGDTATNLATLTGWDATWRAKTVIGFGPFLVGLYITKSTTVYPHMVKWSDEATPGSIPASWDHTDVTKLAGEYDLAESPDLIVDGATLGDVLVIYKERSTYGAQIVGGTEVMRFFRIPGDTGLLGKGCIAHTPLGHVLLIPGDVVIQNGQGPRSILDSAMRNYLFNSLDSGNYGRSFVTVNPTKSEVWVCFPASGQTTCTKAIIWNWEKNTLGLRDLSNVTYGNYGLIPSVLASTTWATDTQTWAEDVTTWDQVDKSASQARMLTCGTAPTIRVVDSTGLMAGSDFEAYVERTGLTFGDESVVKQIRGVRPDIDAVNGTQITVEVCGVNRIGDTPTWSSSTYTVGTTTQADVFATGKYLGYRFKNMTGSNAWRVRSPQFDIVARGRH